MLLVHQAADVLDDHDRVVHHDADRENQPEKRDQVDRVADRQQHSERADQRHRNRQRRHDRRTPVLQKQIGDRVTRNTAITSVMTTSSIDAVMKAVVSNGIP